MQLCHLLDIPGISAEHLHAALSLKLIRALQQLVLLVFVLLLHVTPWKKQHQHSIEGTAKSQNRHYRSWRQCLLFVRWHQKVDIENKPNNQRKGALAIQLQPIKQHVNRPCFSISVNPHYLYIGCGPNLMCPDFTFTQGGDFSVTGSFMCEFEWRRICRFLWKVLRREAVMVENVLNLRFEVSFLCSECYLRSSSRFPAYRSKIMSCL